MELAVIVIYPATARRPHAVHARNVDAKINPVLPVEIREQTGYRMHSGRVIGTKLHGHVVHYRVIGQPVETIRTFAKPLALDPLREGDTN